MVIAALLVFIALFVAWIAAPSTARADAVTPTDLVPEAR